MGRNLSRTRVLGVLSCIFIVACAAGMEGTRVDLQRYTPAFSADLAAYKGLRVNLPDVDNQADNSTLWYYYSPDKRFAYGGNSSTGNYFRNAFEKALLSLGMVVSNTERSVPRAPAVWLTLRSVSDENYMVEVKIQEADWLFFLKTYEISGDPVEPAQRTPDNLEKRAYRMTNKLVETVLTDPEFKRAFLRATADAAKPRER